MSSKKEELAKAIAEFVHLNSQVRHWNIQRYICDKICGRLWWETKHKILDVISERTRNIVIEQLITEIRNQNN